ncbi:MAG TPA: LysR family transcriptional regulator [Candidatus Stackebrandtia faecavium]|nr:LysR family transcriptional regulator [Candidatus Stackebrandtia faecavium]
MLDPRRLRLLYEFANRGSIAATADALGYTASAVSQQLATLEKEAGVSLLDRTARSAALTDSGQKLVNHAAHILGAIEAAESDLAAQEEVPQGRVVVAAYPSAAVALAPPVAHRLRSHSAITLELHQASAAESTAQVRSGDVDIALIDDWSGTRRRSEVGSLSFHFLCHDPLVLVVPRDHPLADAESIHLGELGDESWIATLESEPARRALERLLRGAGITPYMQWQFEGLDTVLTLVARGLGISIVPEMAVRDRRYDVVVHDFDTPIVGRDVYAVHRTASAHRPAVATVLSLLRTAARSRLGNKETDA